MLIKEYKTSIRFSTITIAFAFETEIFYQRLSLQIDLEIHIRASSRPGIAFKFVEDLFDCGSFSV